MEENKRIKKHTPQNWVDSFSAAIEGIILATKTEKNMKIHFGIAFGAIILALILRISKISLLLIFISALFVLFAETFNTAIEYLSDFVSQEHSPHLKAVKNISAGAVLLSAMAAFIIGYEIFSKYLYRVVYYFLIMIKSPAGSDISIIVISLVLVLIIFIKAVFGKGTPLRGGMPSGHAAVAFSIWLMVSFLTFNPVASLLTLVLAFIIAISRIKGGIHSRLEVLMGSLLGILVTALIFKFFYF